jgi:pSer/pThr/pTyr-binding forkhead associated (FHA) protein
VGGRAQVERRRIGRVKGAGNNVCVKDPSVSQKHAELAWSGAAWQLTDLGSSNGTFVNGKELQEGGAFACWSVCRRFVVHPLSAGALRLCAHRHTVPVELHDGDDVLFGEASMVKVHITAAPAPGVAAGYSVEQFLTDQCDALVQRLQVCGAAGDASLAGN